MSAQVQMPLDHIRAACDLYLTLPELEHTPRPIGDVIGGNRVSASMMRWEPIGVVTAIAAYNFPIQTTIWKFIPALLTGSTVILRPSPLTPIATLMIGEAAEAVGLPPGVLNVVVEGGTEGGELLTTHPAVDCVSFTGSTTVGKAIMAQAAATLKHVILELGGKSVQLYFADAVDRAPMGCAGVFAAHAGQACVAPTRMLVPEDRKAEVVGMASAMARSLKVGDPTDPSTVVGPLISAAQRARNEQYVAAAVAAGATVAAGGKRPEGLERGHYFEPTVLDVPDNSNPAAQDEIFGPVICVLGYRDLDHAVAIANDSVYGLAGQVHGNDLAAAVGVAERIRAGAVSINGGYTGAYASSGGYNQSGLGRERGIEGFRALQQVKHLSVSNPA
jgi:aldehyde dehydrogenase (NAD+)